MTKNQIDKLEKAKQELQEVYWQLMDNKEFREAKRVDTIIGKISFIQKLGQSQ